jgi:hypothetical protein
MWCWTATAFRPAYHPAGAEGQVSLPKPLLRQKSAGSLGTGFFKLNTASGLTS